MAKAKRKLGKKEAIRQMEENADLEIAWQKWIHSPEWFLSNSVYEAFKAGYKVGLKKGKV